MSSSSSASRLGMANAFDPSNAGDLAPKVAEIVRRRAELLGPAYRLFYDRPVRFVRGEGVHLFDQDDNEFLDAYNNVPSVGHSHPRVVEAISRQARTLNTHTRYPDTAILDYAERLLATFEQELGNVMFTSTGSEGVDLALRIARKFTGGTGIIVTTHAYHGISTATSAISPSLGSGATLDPGLRLVDLPDSDDSDPATVFGDRVAAAIADMERSGVKLAGFVADTTFSSDGIRSDPAGPDPASFLGAAKEAVGRVGGLYIADEVQAGFGRSGETMWGYQRHGLTPDLVVLGKPMGNGMPIGGVVARPELLEEFGSSMRYFSTFSGNNVCIAAADAVLDVIDDEGLVENAGTVGRYLIEGLGRLSGIYPFLGEARGVGLFIGVDVHGPDDPVGLDPGVASALVNGLMRRRVMIGSTGPGAGCLKIRPPLPFSQQDADRLLEALGETCAELHSA